MKRQLPDVSSGLMLLKMTGYAVILHLALLDPFIRPAFAQEAAYYGLRVGKAACGYMEAGMSYDQASNAAISDSLNAILKSGADQSAVGMIAGAYMRQKCKRTAIERGADYGKPSSGASCMNFIIVGSRKQCI